MVKNLLSRPGKIDKDKIYFRLNPEMVNDLQKLHNVVFIESPIYWKLRKPLLEIRKRINLNSIFNFHREKSELTGVPKYIFDKSAIFTYIKSDTFISVDKSFNEMFT